MNAGELARAATGRSPAEVLQRWGAIAEMAAAIGPEAVALDFEAEHAERERKDAIWAILLPYTEGGVSSWQQVHDALTPEEHRRVDDLLDGCPLPDA